MAQIIWDGNKNWENVWDGKQPWDREIEEKSIPENAVLIDRPDDIIKASIPYMIIPCIVCFVAIFTKKAQSDEFIFNLWLMPLSFIIGFFVAMPLHEFLHAISYPKGAKVYIGVSLKQLRAYAASSAALSKMCIRDRLYSLGRQYSLGSIVPTMCSNFSTSQTVKSLYAQFEKINKTDE